MDRKLVLIALVGALLLPGRSAAIGPRVSIGSCEIWFGVSEVVARAICSDYYFEKRESQGGGAFLLWTNRTALERRDQVWEEAKKLGLDEAETKAHLESAGVLRAWAEARSVGALKFGPAGLSEVSRDFDSFGQDSSVTDTFAFLESAIGLVEQRLGQHSSPMTTSVHRVRDPSGERIILSLEDRDYEVEVSILKVGGLPLRGSLTEYVRAPQVADREMAGGPTSPR